MSVPHTKTGTESEGQLFYFGVMPYYRGKNVLLGCTSIVAYVKEMGATYYIGSTHTSE